MKRREAGITAAVILARRGSKGVPGKNVAMVGGRPCIAWTIDAAIQAVGVSLVAVSTDDADAKSIARSFGPGVAVVDRPRELAGDRATVDAAARHALGVLEERELGGAGRRIARVVVLYANVPIRPVVRGVGLIDRALELMEKTGCDSVQSYAPVGKHHPWWTARVSERGGRVTPWQGKVLNHGVYRRQELPPAYVPDGGVIVCTRAALMCELGVAAGGGGPHAFFGRDRRGVTNPEGSVVDIDAPVDLLVADALLKRA